MEGFEIDSCLESFEILVDKREQPSERATRRYNSFGCPFTKATLNYGDYCYNFKLPNNEKAIDINHTVFAPVVIERKMSLEELSGCFCQSRERFTNEFERALKHGAKVYLLTENASWEKLINGKYNTRYHQRAYFASITTLMARYDVSVIFCREETTGKLIREILYRELKERLLKGDYDTEMGEDMG